MDKNRLVEPDFIDGDTKEISLRPKWLDEYIGQEKVVDNLKIFIEAAKNRMEPLIIHY